MSDQNNKTVRRYLIAMGCLLGATLGLFLGASHSPVIGSGIAGLFTVATLLLNFIVTDEQKFVQRAKMLTFFGAPLISLMLVFAIIGVIWKSSQPSPSEQIIQSLSTLSLDDKQIAKYVADIYKSSDVGDMVAPVGMFYSSEGDNDEPSGPKNDKDKCPVLAPPAGMYEDIEFLREFEKAGSAFQRLSTFVKEYSRSRSKPLNEMEKLHMLRAGYFVICGW